MQISECDWSKFKPMGFKYWLGNRALCLGHVMPQQLKIVFYTRTLYDRFNNFNGLPPVVNFVDIIPSKSIHALLQQNQPCTVTLSYTNNNKVVIYECRHRKTSAECHIILQKSWNFWDLCVWHTIKFLMEVSTKKYLKITQTKEQWAKAELPWRVEIYSTFNRHGRMSQSYESEYWHNAP